MFQTWDLFELSSENEHASLFQSQATLENHGYSSTFPLASLSTVLIPSPLRGFKGVSKGKLRENEALLWETLVKK